MSTEEASKTIDGEAVSAADVAPAATADVTPAATAEVKADEEGEQGFISLPKVDDTTTATTTTATTNNNNNNQNDRGHWDQTSQKVVVRNVLKYIRHKEIAKLTTSWLVGHEDKIQILKSKKPPKDNWIKVTLADESQVDPFIELINKGGEDGEAMVNGRGKPLRATRADAFLQNDRNDGNGDRKRKDRGGDDKGGNQSKQMRRSDNRPPIRILSKEEVRDAITPLWKLTYEEQLDSKAREMSMKCAAKIVKEIKGKFRILEREAKRGQRKGTVKLYDWMQEKNAIKMAPPVPSPQIYEYRNKCEFTVGYRLVAPAEEKEEKKEDDAMKVEDAKVDKPTNGSKEGEKDAEMKEGEVKAEESTNESTTEKKEDTAVEFTKIPAAGFLAQGWAGGVYHPHILQNMPDWSCGICDIINEFLPTSTAPPYDSKVHRGVWRTVTLRCSLRTREVMVIVQHAPPKGGVGALEDGSDDYSNVFEGEKERLVGMLTKGVIPATKRDYPEDHVVDEKRKEEEEGKEGLKVTSIFFQEFGGVSHPGPDHPVQHVFGKKSLEENLGKCTFQISPGAFFQTNTEGAEVLYSIVVERIKEVTKDPKDTLLLDVCCGTGTIGLTCLKEEVVGKLVGVDISEPAIKDAEINATKNGYTEPSTTRFIASAAEKILPETMKDLPRHVPIVAVVDPARDGLHNAVIKTLRANEGIQRLVYVSCNPTATLVRDAGMLCSPPTKKYPGRPFKPTMSQPVDMFPLTKHCEMVMTFDRMSEEEFEKSTTE